MNNLYDILMDALTKRSSRNAGMPNTHPGQLAESNEPQMPEDGSMVLESLTETENIAGFTLEIGNKDYTVITPQRQLHRVIQSTSVILGCGHYINKTDKNAPEGNADYKIAGMCHYCRAENLLLFKQGLITSYDADRLSLVCTCCARMTESGLLCCHKHSHKIPQPDGTKTYIDQQQMENVNREQTISRILKPFSQLFCSDDKSSDAQ